MDRQEAALVEAIDAAPGDPGPVLVYADWLQVRGDPRGELITVQHAREARPGDAALARHERELSDELAAALVGRRNGLELEWRDGFIDAIGVLRDLTPPVAESCDGPMFRRVRCIRILHAFHRGERALAPVLGDRIRRLEYGRPNGQWTWGRALAETVAAYGALRELVIVGLDDLELPADLPLTRFVAWNFGPRATPALVTIEWPLEELVLHPYRAEGLALDQLRPILDGQLPRLRHLGVTGIAFTDELLHLLAGSTLLRQLDTLAISPRQLGERGIRTILDHADAFARVRFTMPITERESGVELGDLLRDRLGRPGEAIECYRARARDKPADTSASIGLGTTLHALGRVDEAITAFDVVAASDEPAEGWYGRHRVLRQLGHRAEAAEALRNAVTADFRENAAWWTELAELLDELGRADEAAAARVRAASTWTR